MLNISLTHWRQQENVGRLEKLLKASTSGKFYSPHATGFFTRNCHLGGMVMLTATNYGNWQVGATWSMGSKGKGFRLFIMMPEVMFFPNERMGYTNGSLFAQNSISRLTRVPTKTMHTQTKMVYRKIGRETVFCNPPYGNEKMGEKGVLKVKKANDCCFHDRTSYFTTTYSVSEVQRAAKFGGSKNAFLGLGNN